MQADRYTVERLVADLRRAHASSATEEELIRRVKPIARHAAAHAADWLHPQMCVPDPRQGFGIHVLHEEDDHRLAVFVASWLAGHGTPPHDHGTWAVVAGIEGSERNLMWKRRDDGSRPGYAELEAGGERALGKGDVLAMPSGAIHSVRNDGDRVTVSLHIYGRHVNHTQRSQFDPVRRTEAPFKLVIGGGRP